MEKEEEVEENNNNRKKTIEWIVNVDGIRVSSFPFPLFKPFDMQIHIGRRGFIFLQFNAKYF